jgi:hypothetical protein
MSKAEPALPPDAEIRGQAVRIKTLRAEKTSLFTEDGELAKRRAEIRQRLREINAEIDAATEAMTEVLPLFDQRREEPAAVPQVEEKPAEPSSPWNRSYTYDLQLEKPDGTPLLVAFKYEAAAGLKAPRIELRGGASQNSYYSFYLHAIPEDFAGPLSYATACARALVRAAGVELREDKGSWRGVAIKSLGLTPADEKVFRGLNAKTAGAVADAVAFGGFNSLPYATMDRAREALAGFNTAHPEPARTVEETTPDGNRIRTEEDAERVRDWKRYRVEFTDNRKPRWVKAASSGQAWEWAAEEWDNVSTVNQDEKSVSLEVYAVPADWEPGRGRVIEPPPPAKKPRAKKPAKTA